MYPFVGDLSEADAKVLVDVGEGAARILEFGAGGSTQIFAQALQPFGQLWTVEPSLEWLGRTAARLADLQIPRGMVTLSHTFPEWEWCDVVFVDGPTKSRLSFALDAWPILKVGGQMLWHDDRRHEDQALICAFLRHVFSEASLVSVHAGGWSNITMIAKGNAHPYKDWNVGREEWQIGRGDIPPDWIERCHSASSSPR